MASTTNQRNITDYFNTISNSNQRTKLGKLTKNVLKNDDETIVARKPTPKRRSTIESTKSVPAAKRSKSSAKNKTCITEKNGKRNKIDYGPNMNVIRKLNFDDCTDQNNNNDVQNSFTEYLKSNDKNFETKQSSNDDQAPLIKAEDVKERLRSCKNLSKLKEQLANINNCAEKIRQFKEMKIKYQENLTSSPNRKKSIKNSPTKLSSPIKNSFSIVSSTSPIIKSVLKTPTKKSTKDNESEYELPLPIPFKRLLELFKVIDYNSWRMYKRHEVCTFDKMKQVVEDSTHRTFQLDTMLKILTILKDKPKYKLSWELYSGQLKLILSPIYKEDNLKCLNSLGVLLEREKEFHQHLLELTRIEHLKFLSSMDIKFDKENQIIYRWHPMFQLDSIPDIKPDYSLLPSKPNDPSSANKDQNSVKKLMKTTILDYFSAKKNEQTITNENNTSTEKTVSNKIQEGVLKGVSQDLLAKVRAKEAAKLAKLMCRAPEKDHEIRLLSKLMDISRIIYECFLGSSIRSIEKDDLIQRISNSMPMSINEAKRHFDYLQKFELDSIGSKWIRIIQLRNMEYVQIDTKYPLSQLCSAFRKRMQCLQSD